MPKSATPIASTLVLGLGNPTRQDDAAGSLLAQTLARLRLPDTEVRFAQQLTPEWAADWAQRRRVLLIDAAVAGPEVDLREIDAPPAAAAAASHTGHPATLVALTTQLYGHQPAVWLCSVRADSLEFGESPTRTMQHRLKEAESRVLQWLSRFS